MPAVAPGSAVAGRDLGSGITVAAVGLAPSILVSSILASSSLASAKPARESSDINCGASSSLAARSLMSSSAKAARSSGCKATLSAGDAGIDAGKKRSSKEAEMRSVFPGSAADASADRSESVIQAAAPSATATAAKASAIIRDHPMRRRDNGSSAIAASKTIKPPETTSPDTRPIPPRIRRVAPDNGARSEA